MLASLILLAHQAFSLERGGGWCSRNTLVLRWARTAHWICRKSTWHKGKSYETSWSSMSPALGLETQAKRPWGPFPVGQSVEASVAANPSAQQAGALGIPIWAAATLALVISLVSLTTVGGTLGPGRAQVPGCVCMEGWCSNHWWPQVNESWIPGDSLELIFYGLPFCPLCTDPATAIPFWGCVSFSNEAFNQTILFPTPPSLTTQLSHPDITAASLFPAGGGHFPPNTAEFSSAPISVVLLMDFLPYLSFIYSCCLAPRTGDCA